MRGKSLQHETSYQAEHKIESLNQPLIKNLKRFQNLNPKTAPKSTKYIDFVTLKYAFQNQDDLMNYMSFHKDLENKIVRRNLGISKIDNTRKINNNQLQVLPHLDKELENKPQSKLLPNYEKHQSKLLPNYEDFSKERFVDKNEMRFTMDAYYSQMQRRPYSKVYQRKVPTKMIGGQRLNAANKSVRCQRSLSLNRSGDREEPIQRDQIRSCQESDESFQVRISYNSMIRQIGKEVEQEQNQSFQYSDISNPLCQLGDIKKQMDLLWENANINIEQLRKVVKSVKYKTPTENLIDFLKQ